MVSAYTTPPLAGFGAELVTESEGDYSSPPCHEIDAKVATTLLWLRRVVSLEIMRVGCSSAEGEGAGSTATGSIIEGAGDKEQREQQLGPAGPIGAFRV